MDFFLCIEYIIIIIICENENEKRRNSTFYCTEYLIFCGVLYNI